MRRLLLALGNDLLGDDAVGLAAARALRPELEAAGVDVVECLESGLALLDHLEGYDRALLIDAVTTGKHPSGTVLEFDAADFKGAPSVSPHFTGLPDVLALADKLRIPFPSELRILAMEIVNPLDFKEGLGPDVKAAFPEFLRRAKDILVGEGRHAVQDRAGAVRPPDAHAGLGKGRPGEAQA